AYRAWCARDRQSGRSNSRQAATATPTGLRAAPLVLRRSRTLLLGPQAPLRASSPPTKTSIEPSGQAATGGLILTPRVGLDPDASEYAYAHLRSSRSPPVARSSRLNQSVPMITNERFPP